MILGGVRRAPRPNPQVGFVTHVTERIRSWFAALQTRPLPPQFSSQPNSDLRADNLIIGNAPVDAARPPSPSLVAHSLSHSLSLSLSLCLSV